MDTYCQKYGDTEHSFAKEIEKGHIYEMGYPKCVLKHWREKTLPSVNAPDRV